MGRMLVAEIAAKDIVYRGATSFSDPRSDFAVSNADAVTKHSGLSLYWRDGQPVPGGALIGSGGTTAVKRIFDVAGAAIALLLLLPLLALVAIAIKLSGPGPVFFVQQREGLNGNLFGILKFRTMSREIGDLSDGVQTLPGDSRVTALGRLLRRTSIDELPQLINVLRGDMSLVGPRPHVPGMRIHGQAFAQLVPYYRLRGVVLPGITGWAQANGLRGAISTISHANARVEHDLAYIHNWSLWLDCKILLVTLWREFINGTGE